MKAITRHAAAIATWQNACRIFKDEIAHCRKSAKQYHEIAIDFAVIGMTDETALFESIAFVTEHNLVDMYKKELREAQEQLKAAKKAQKKEGGAK